jgi:uncharacterized protein
MQFNVAQLLKEPTGGVRRYQLAEDITSLDPELNVLGPLVGALQLMRINSGILVTGELSTAIQATCNRCLEPIVLPVRFTVTENFRPLTEVETGRYLRPEEFEGDADDLEDAALLIDEHHILDIREIVRQNIWLALPMYPGCNWPDPDHCPRLAQIMQDSEDVRLLRDTDPQSEAETAVDPRWLDLLKLRDDLER